MIDLVKKVNLSKPGGAKPAGQNNGAKEGNKA